MALPSAAGAGAPLYTSFESLEDAFKKHAAGFRGKLVFPGTSHRQATVREGGVLIQELWSKVGSAFGSNSRGVKGMFYPCKGEPVEVFVLKALKEKKGDASVEQQIDRQRGESLPASHPRLLKALFTIELISQKRGVEKVTMVYRRMTRDLFVAASTTGFSSAVSSKIIVDLLEVVRAIHTQGCVHRDLKPENLLLDKDDNLFIADFEFMRRKGESVKLQGSDRYVPLSEYRRHKATWESNGGLQPATTTQDIFAVATLIYACFGNSELNHGACFAKALSEERRLEAFWAELSWVRKNPTCGIQELWDRLSPFLNSEKK